MGNSGNSTWLIPVTTKLDIKDYINMREAGLPTGGKWKQIRSLIINGKGETLWQVTNRDNLIRFNNDIPIGVDTPSLGFVKSIIF